MPRTGWNFNLPFQPVG